MFLEVRVILLTYPHSDLSTKQGYFSTSLDPTRSLVLKWGGKHTLYCSIQVWRALTISVCAVEVTCPSERPFMVLSVNHSRIPTDLLQELFQRAYLAPIKMCEKIYFCCSYLFLQAARTHITIR